MKTPDDPRHVRRQILVQQLFKIEFHKQNISQNAKKIMKHKDEIDKSIAKYAPEFPIEKINRVDLAILRLALYEMLVEKTEPKNVIIDEAIELAKEFGGKTSANFINGVLGGIMKNEYSA